MTHKFKIGEREFTAIHYIEVTNLDATKCDSFEGKPAKFICFYPNCTEEQAASIVEKSENGLYYDYNLFRGHLQNYVETAIESLTSKMEAENLYVNNPAGNKPLPIPLLQRCKKSNCNGSDNCICLSVEMNAWNEAQQRTSPTWIIMEVKI